MALKIANSFWLTMNHINPDSILIVGNSIPHHRQYYNYMQVKQQIFSIATIIDHMMMRS